MSYKYLAALYHTDLQVNMNNFLILCERLQFLPRRTKILFRHKLFGLYGVVFRVKCLWHETHLNWIRKFTFKINISITQKIICNPVVQLQSIISDQPSGTFCGNNKIKIRSIFKVRHPLSIYGPVHFLRDCLGIQSLSSS